MQHFSSLNSTIHSLSIFNNPFGRTHFKRLKLQGLQSLEKHYFIISTEALNFPMKKLLKPPHSQFQATPLDLNHCSGLGPFQLLFQFPKVQREIGQMLAFQVYMKGYNTANVPLKAFSFSLEHHLILFTRFCTREWTTKLTYVRQKSMHQV